MTLLAHAGDVQLYLLVPGVVFFVAFRLARGPLPASGGRPPPGSLKTTGGRS